MVRTIVAALLLVYLISGCSKDNSTNNKAKYVTEIAAAENAFAQMAKEKGLQAAFTFFAADSAVINRGDVLIKGKNSIFSYYGKPSGLQNVKLEWKPDFIGVSANGDLGYTYGKYHFSGMDSFGKMIENEGIFHTVWERQADGSWKFVYD
ncbi:MAG TPA: DUF4440 domain-containing protein [Williamwhitmania sp.]|nr:DUF4440 domain-containing protein [Williamwhitmania sp.]